MIQPLSLRQRDGAVKLTSLTTHYTEKAGAIVGVTVWEIDSGPFQGAAVAMTRLQPQDHVTGLAQYQVFRPTSGDANNVATCASFDAALHHVMACAYAHVARKLEREARDGIQRRRAS